MTIPDTNVMIGLGVVNVLIYKNVLPVMVLAYGCRQAALARHPVTQVWSFARMVHQTLLPANALVQALY